jgi:uncharacterized protein (DUF952 family)
MKISTLHNDRFLAVTRRIGEGWAMNRLIYKICDENEWRAAETAGTYTGAPVDLADGFIHFSTAAQVAETAAKHFAGREGLLLLSVDAEALGSALKWEPSRGGALFPHLYGHLPVSAVQKAEALPWGKNMHQFPELALE